MTPQSFRKLDQDISPVRHRPIMSHFSSPTLFSHRDGYHRLVHIQSNVTRDRLHLGSSPMHEALIRPFPDGLTLDDCMP